MCSSSEIVVEAHGLGKRYRIGGARQRYNTFRETVMNAAARPIRGLRRLAGRAAGPPASPAEIWALRGVSFELHRGDVLGIIGRNGAGKTTLLKIISRITKPTEGRARVGGRVGSLLEVGTGFHPELTGRENVFLNGVILGMTRREVLAKFDEIVAFAEMGKFIDTPVKRYSTGMATRLAFAVAAHLEPEILAIDEVLSVGDMGFRKKCMGKMRDISTQGRTILFVSHEMAAVRRLCRTGLWLDQGMVRAQGGIDEVVRQYEGAVLGPGGGQPWRMERASPPRVPKYFSSVELSSAEGQPAAAFRLGDILVLTIGMTGVAPARAHFVEWFINEPDHGNRVAWGGTYWMDEIEVPHDCERISFRIGPLPLTEGRYSISLAMGVPSVMDLDAWHDAIGFEIAQCVPSGTRNSYSTRYAPTYIPYEVEIGRSPLLRRDSASSVTGEAG